MISSNLNASVAMGGEHILAVQARKERPMAFSVPPLPYDYNALEPHVDEQTMRIHHDKHHAAYVNNLNAALEQAPDLQNKSVEELIGNLNSVPENIRTA